MKLLLDTHTFLWIATAPAYLSPAARVACQDRNNLLILSTVSVWELQIKVQIGKLTLAVPLVTLIRNQQTVNGVQTLPVELSHVPALDSLPLHHKDPFDRLLIAQAHIEGATMVRHCQP